MNSTGPQSAAGRTVDVNELTILAVQILGDLKLSIGGSIAFGAYCAVSTFALNSILQRQHRRWRIAFLIAILSFASLCVSLNWVLYTAFITTEIRKTLMEDTDLPLSSRADSYFASLLSRFFVHIVDIPQGTGDVGLIFLLNDALAVWRAVAIWKVRSRVWSLPSLLYSMWTANLALFIATTVLDGYIFTRGADAGVANSDNYAVLFITVSSLSIAINLLATAMIGYTAYESSRYQALSKLRSTSGIRILIFLTESGSLYAAMQIARLASTLVVVPSTQIWGSLYTGCVLFNNVTGVITAMYTPVLLLIVNYGHFARDINQPVRLSDQALSGSSSDTRVDTGAENAGSDTILVLERDPL